MSSLHLQMTAQGSLVKFSWTGLISRAYCVDRECLDVAGRNVREILQSIASDYVHQETSYFPHLQTLARAGERLQSALFNSSEKSDSADEVCAFLNKLKAHTPLVISSDATVHVPWNFVFTSDPEMMPEPTGKISDFDLFWANRFKIRSRFHQAALPPQQPIPRSRVKTLLAMHLECFRRAARALSDNQELQEKIDRLLEHEVGVTDNWIDCRTKWREVKNDDSILYIFAHSDGKKLMLRDEIDSISDRDKYLLDPNGFSVCFRKDRNSQSNTLCFINGCRTADGDRGNGFLSITSMHGFQGFIGSEAEIPNDWATRYAVEFLCELLEKGSSVDRAYERSRRSCFPMSLWYSCYANPDFRLSDE